MSQSLEQQLVAYVSEHAAEGILLDTNVLLLLLAAEFRPALIGGPRLDAYEIRDAIYLAEYVRRFSRILTTPHILTEISNLLPYAVKGRARSDFFAWLHPIFCSNENTSLVQCTVPGSDIDRPLFTRLGLTDATLAASAKAGQLLLTDDLDLYVAAVSEGAHALNFTHMREAAGFFE